MMNKDNPNDLDEGYYHKPLQIILDANQKSKPCSKQSEEHDRRVKRFPVVLQRMPLASLQTTLNAEEYHCKLRKQSQCGLEGILRSKNSGLVELLLIWVAKYFVQKF